MEVALYTTVWLSVWTSLELLNSAANAVVTQYPHPTHQPRSLLIIANQILDWPRHPIRCDGLSFKFYYCAGSLKMFSSILFRGLSSLHRRTLHFKNVGN